MSDANSNEATVGTGPKKERSPSFPYIGLTKALERARQVYAHAKRFEIRTADISTAWGLGSKSSGTQQTVAALLAFGLLEDQGSGENRKLKITDLAFKALEDQRDGVKENALAEAATKPKLIAECLELWKGGRPSDAICISELRIDRGFTTDGALAFLRVFDDTAQYTKRQASALGSVNSELPSPQHSAFLSEEIINVAAPAPIATATGKASIVTEAAALTAKGTWAGNYREEKFALTEGDVVIRFPDGLSADSVGDLDAYIQVFLKKARREAGIKN